MSNYEDQKNMLAQHGYVRKDGDEHATKFEKNWGDARLRIVVSDKRSPYALGRLVVNLAGELITKLVYDSHSVTLTPEGLAQMEREFAATTLKSIRDIKTSVSSLTLPKSLEALAEERKTKN